MAPTILIVGSTGNTGRSVVETLPNLLKDSATLANHRILALTRNKDSSVAKQFASLPGVEVAEQHWNEITADWLRQNEVVRAFVASHNEPHHFAEESQFYNEALRAGVKYVVRISTTAANVVPDSLAYYPRSHWAIEQMLSQPEFDALRWTSLQPNVFLTFILSPAVEFIKQYRKTGQQDTLRLMLDASTPVGVIDADDVGLLAAHLLAQDDTATHTQAKLILNGPKDITGEQIVKLVEAYIGARVDHVNYKDVSFIEQWADSLTTGSKNVIRSITNAPVSGWEGRAKAATTSKAVLDLAPPRGTMESVVEAMLAQ